jgi:hypothetical protein
MQTLNIEEISGDLADKPKRKYYELSVIEQQQTQCWGDKGELFTESNNIVIYLSKEELEDFYKNISDLIQKN